MCDASPADDAGPAAVPADLVDRARAFATDAHRRVGQLRKYTGQPYEEHLRRVAEIVAGVTDDPETIAAAWLHDVVEDTPTTIEDVEREFGHAVRALVDAVTDVSRPQDGNRAARKARDREHLAAAPPRAQTVKLADLIDNCQDICRHSPRFGRVFVGEMAALLDALTAGDASLMRRARRTMDKWSARLPPKPVAAEPSERAALRLDGRGRRAVRLFARTFRALDVAEELPVLDEDEAAGPCELGRCPVVGLRRRGRVAAWALRDEADGASAAERARPIRRSQVVDGDARLADVVMALTRHDYCFVTRNGEVVAYAGRAEMQGPVARMWLFGMITSVELAMTEGIRSLDGKRDWETLLTPGRLEKARELQALRAANGRPVPLLDCLQLADKVAIVLALDEWQGARPLLRGSSKAESQRLVRDLEHLRNGLAHAQDIVAQDWAQIARMARRLEELDRD